MPDTAARWHPTLLSSCALATTAAEARYRVNAPEFTRRSSRVIALDGESARIVRELGGRSWGGGHFLVFESAVPDDALLRHSGTEGTGTEGTGSGGTALLSEELAGADTVVMIASAGANAEAASVIGDAAAARGIMSAGLVLPGGDSVNEVVSALRPNAMVLVVLRDAADVPEVLSALRV
ncbi:MAG TPA: hypothetical protein VG164_05635 [Trebonia sp.]|nr:hypothetical protein [Trebonia sp.]